MDAHQLAQTVEKLSVGVERLRQVNVSIPSSPDYLLIMDSATFSLSMVRVVLESVQVWLLTANW